MQTNDTLLHVVAIAFCAVRQLRTYIHVCFQCFFNVVSMWFQWWLDSQTMNRDFLQKYKLFFAGLLPAWLFLVLWNLLLETHNSPQWYLLYYYHYYHYCHYYIYYYGMLDHSWSRIVFWTDSTTGNPSICHSLFSSSCLLHIAFVL